LQRLLRVFLQRFGCLFDGLLLYAVDFGNDVADANAGLIRRFLLPSSVLNSFIPTTIMPLVNIFTPTAWPHGMSSISGYTLISKLLSGITPRSLGVTLIGCFSYPASGAVKSAFPWAFKT
jgi:hypothetical protein